MARLTKTDIEKKLLSGTSIVLPGPGKKAHLLLGDATERRLFAFLLGSGVRQYSALPETFVSGLAAAFAGTTDPAEQAQSQVAGAVPTGRWRLKSIETEGFGGLNTWGGPPFSFEFEQQSYLFEGPNGTGKSSLVGALIWALSGDRPRDQAKSNSDEPQTVFTTNDKVAGRWPPIACYPTTVDGLKHAPYVRVTLTFSDSTGKLNTVERILKDGQTVVKNAGLTDVPLILLEAGVFMPARLSTLRFDEGQNRLTDAIQKLTGLDDLIAIGEMVDGLCHKSREYLSYQKKELAVLAGQFKSLLTNVQEVLLPVGVSVPYFKHSDAEGDDGAISDFAKPLIEKAADLAAVISDDLSPALNLSNVVDQQRVTAAISAAQEDIGIGLGKAASWVTLEAIREALDHDSREKVSAAIAAARSKTVVALEMRARNLQDAKFRLKVMAAQWHQAEHSGSITSCPLCTQALDGKTSLTSELEELRSLGGEAAKEFDDNINAIAVELRAALPSALRSISIDFDKFEPRSALVADLLAHFVMHDRYAKILVKAGSLMEAALATAPPGALAVANTPNAQDPAHIVVEIAMAERLLQLSDWCDARSEMWTDWWKQLTLPIESADNQEVEAGAFESVASHLNRLSTALAKAEPFRRAAAAIEQVRQSGKAAATIEAELKQRDDIAEKLKPLKGLGALAAAVAQDAIEGLSDRISALLKRMHLSEQLRFHATQFHRKEGIIVRGAFAPDIQIDATLVANTSWLRIVLWAFVFALREEAVEQAGNDPFPLLVLDDPQSTFDSTHRYRWGQYLAGLQGQPQQIQAILTTYDEAFLEVLKIAGVSGRQAMMAAAGPELGHVGIFEGESLERSWEVARKTNTPKSAQDFIGDVRVYLEGSLRLMLRGEDATIASVGSGFVLGESREKLRQLNESGLPPWDRPQFKKLISLLGKQTPQIKHMEMSHHSDLALLGVPEAADVWEYWQKKLSASLDHCFRLARQHYQLHGGLKALHALPPTASLPDGYKSIVKQISLNVIGRAAALSGGQVADGCVDVNKYDDSNSKKIVLAQHSAYQLASPTLEPTARVGDLLLVKEAGEPSPRSLVIALSDERILARRFEVADNHSDVAVLTAQAINPRQIAAPVVGHKATFTLHKVIGVLYGQKSWGTPPTSEMEVCECQGGSGLNAVASNVLGLVEVVGHSAEPLALDGQYLIVGQEIGGVSAMKACDGMPVIAADTDDKRYFKRLRASSDRIVLESLDSGGDYGPIVMHPPGHAENCLQHVWPVVGVLFELPS